VLHSGEFLAVETPDTMDTSLHQSLPPPNMPVRKSSSAPKPRRFATEIISHFLPLSSHRVLSRKMLPKPCGSLK